MDRGIFSEMGEDMLFGPFVGESLCLLYIRISMVFAKHDTSSHNQ